MAIIRLTKTLLKSLQSLDTGNFLTPVIPEQHLETLTKLGFVAVKLGIGLHITAEGRKYLNSL
jgi:hypothetical protein